MIVRVRMNRRSGLRQEAAVPAVAPQNEPVPTLVTWQEMAGAIAAVLPMPIALCLALAIWRIGQDMGFARTFFITEGPLSHWQFWVALAGLIFISGQWLNRRSRPDDDEPALG